MNDPLKSLEGSIASAIQSAVQAEFGISMEQPVLQFTRREFSGTYTWVAFGLAKTVGIPPDEVGQIVGKQLIDSCKLVKDFNIVKGFLNVELADEAWVNLWNALQVHSYGVSQIREDEPAAMVEYSSPNTNKPLHLGHVRNNLLGHSVSELIKATGKKVVKVQIINDRGIHICKSMLAWKKFGAGETPESSGTKGDHLVGKYYVAFDLAYREEMAALVASGRTEEQAKAEAPLMREAQEMLRLWEEGDAAVMNLWRTMNQWVYAGFETTYRRLGVSFDKNYYESETYVLGKQDVERGLELGVFYRKDDGSVWIDLRPDGLDEKVVLRSDGTSVYMTQDLGTAVQRFLDFNIDSLTYVVGNEQDYHFKVLFLILKKLGYAWAHQLVHLSYGMVDLPNGRMKSREGSVVDADDLLSEMETTAAQLSEELGKLEGMPEADKAALYRTLGHGALKYFILKVDPTKRMVFNPEESVDFNGNTGPFLQYTHARIASLLRKAGNRELIAAEDYAWDPRETEVLFQLAQFPRTVQQAADARNPAAIANYVYELVKSFNGLYQNLSILNADQPAQVALRVGLAERVGYVVRTGLGFLGITAPDRM